MAQRSVEMFIGRLLTDEACRTSFLLNPVAALTAFAELGHELTAVEVAALIAVPPHIWRTAADGIDPRLQRT